MDWSRGHDRVGASDGSMSPRWVCAAWALTLFWLVGFGLSAGCGRPSGDGPPKSSSSEAEFESSKATSESSEVDASTIASGSQEESKPEEASESEETTESATLASTDAQSTDETRGRSLYLKHCAACHGDRGDGQGIAAAFLFPKPRDFRSGRFRLVSTSGGVPTREDLDAVLKRGMPGSAMPPWYFLNDDDRSALIDEVMRLFRVGLRESYIARYQEEEDLSDEELAEELKDPDFQAEISEFVASRSTPGELTEVPPLGEPTAETIALGKELYVKQGCVSCHGEKGVGDGVKKMIDDEGFPTAPRDFTRGIFKGGHDPVSLYRRTAFGMRGTPMPATVNLKPSEIAAIVHWMRSLSDEATREAAVVRRKQIEVVRVEKIPAGFPFDDPVWDASSATKLQVIPVWWRNDASIGLRVEAIHDGSELVFRLRWNDATWNKTSHKTDSFPDAIAIQLTRGGDEPFLGMGSAESPVDIWYCNADRQARLALEKVYPRIMVGSYPFSERGVSAATYDREGTKDAKQPLVSLPAVAAGNSITPVEGVPAAASLEAAGPRTLTFRPRVSWKVVSQGRWQDGTWTAIFRRPLQVSSEEGVTATPGATQSVAFAVWDGAHRDRNGQKLITIWNDLHLQP